MQALGQYGMGAGLPGFSLDNASLTGNSADNELDFNMLSEYLFNEEEKFPAWAGLDDNLGNDGNDMSDQEDHSSIDDPQRRRKSDGGTKGKSKDQLDRRRERNRVLARKTRLRKKFFFESLQKQVAQLATENELLKNVIKSRMNTDLRSQILAECKTFDLPPVVANNAAIATSMLEKADYNLMQAIQAAQRSFVITDPSLPDNPIIFASQGFLELCGYRLEEVLGRNCRFLQGPNTDQKQVAVMRKGIQDGVDTSVCLLNYRADGSQFYNQIFVAALRDADQKIINYVGVQVEIKQNPEKKMAEGDTSNADSSVSTSKTSSHATPSSSSARPKRARGSANKPEFSSCAMPSYAPGSYSKY